MSFFDEASLAFLPSGGAGKDTKAYSIKPTDGSGDFTFSRGSNLAATRVGPTGLIEKGRENLVLQSNQFDTTWATINSSVTSGQSGYDGSSDAWLLTASSTSNARVQQNKSFSGVHTYSVYAKSGTNDFLYIRSNGAITCGAYFDISNGTTSNSANLITESITSVGNGWYRCSITFNASSSTDVRAYVVDGFGSILVTSGSNIYIQDAQLEIGLAATDYIESGATTGKAGLLEDEPRFDYSGGATCPSLLLEPSRTNLITQSEYITNTLRATITHNQATSPEGLQNAILVVDSTDANSHKTGEVLAYLGGTDTAVYSIFAKKQNNRYINLRIIDDAANVSGSINFYNATFDLESGVVTDDYEFGTPTNPFSDIEDYGNGWYRCWVGLTKKSGVTRTDCSIYLVNSSSAGINPTYAGTGNDGNYLYGLQLEAGSYPTSYIPNHSGGTITRGGENCSKTGVSDLIGQTEGTVFIETFSNNAQDGTTRIQLSSGTSTSDWIFLSCPEQLGSEFKSRVFINNGGSNQVNSYGSSLSSGNHKYALAYKENDVVLYVDGVLQISDTSASIPTCDKLTICGLFPTSNNTANKLSKHNQVLLFDTRLSNADLATLTTL